MIYSNRGMAGAAIIMLVLAAIVVVMVAYFSFKGYAAMQEKSRQHDLALLMGQLDADSSSLSGSYGSTSEKSYALPSGIAEVCFADIANRADLEKSPSYRLRPFVRDSVESGVADNVFFLDNKGEIVQSMPLASASVPYYPYLLCKQNKDGQFSLRWESRGKKAVLMNDDIIKAEVALAEKDLVAISSDESVRVFAEKGTAIVGDKALSFRIAPPTSDDALTESLEFLSTQDFCNDNLLDSAGTHIIPFKAGKKVSGQGLRIEFYMPPNKKCENSQDNALVFYYADEDAPVSYAGDCNANRIVFWICDV